jgi:DnaK suppressor protein
MKCGSITNLKWENVLIKEKIFMKKSLYKITKTSTKRKNKMVKKVAKKSIVKKVLKKAVKLLSINKKASKSAPKKAVSKVVKKLKNGVAMPKLKAKTAKVKIKAQKVMREVSFKKHSPTVSTSNTREQTIFGPVNVKPYQIGKKEVYMNNKQHEHFRNVLLTWKSQLMAEVDRTMHHLQDDVANYPDPVDRASQEEEFNLELRTRDRERKLLRKIEETLSRITDHDYGYCDDCGAEIGIRRLEARPTATQCIECKTISEIREKQIGDGS